MTLGNIFLIILGLLLFIEGIFAIVKPEKLKKIVSFENKKVAKNFGIVLIIIGIGLFIFAGIFIYWNTTTDYSHLNNNAQESTISEQQMNDLGYYKENGKWNYEGGDAGVNDGKTGD